MKATISRRSWGISVFLIVDINECLPKPCSTFTLPVPIHLDHIYVLVDLLSLEMDYFAHGCNNLFAFLKIIIVNWDNCEERSRRYSTTLSNLYKIWCCVMFRQNLTLIWPFSVLYCINSINMYLFILMMKIIFILHIFSLDINECGLSQCAAGRATCKNTIGSFTCACNTGFFGNGMVCDCKLWHIFYAYVYFYNLLKNVLKSCPSPWLIFIWVNEGKYEQNHPICRKEKVN
jgi:hypothetical protein